MAKTAIAAQRKAPQSSKHGGLMALASFKSSINRHGFTVDTSDITFIQLYGEGEEGALDIHLRNTEECITLQFPGFDVAEQVYDTITARMEEDEDVFEGFEAGDNDD